MLWLYNIGIQIYSLIIKFFFLFSAKARLFNNGRVNIFKKITEKIDASKTHVWFHFASLGEFEQGRPVLEKIKERYPDKHMVITFFSPSGYEIRKDYPLASGVFYLPLDTPGNAKKLIEVFNPELVIFTKYEYWFHYFSELNRQQIPLIIISGIFRKDQIFFKWYGGFNRKILKFVNHFFVQNEESKSLLQNLQIENVSISGDTRFDRVYENATYPKTFDHVKLFCADQPTFIAGSTWPEDERLLAGLIKDYPDWKFIIAPHEVDRPHIEALQKLIPNHLKYSDLATSNTSAQTLIIDNIGLLSSLYQYGSIAYIGGGFGAGIHNTLEAAAFGLPVIFGPRYSKFQEAKDLISIGAAISIEDQLSLLNAFNIFAENKNAGTISKQYVKDKTGATDQIITYIARYIRS